VSNIFCGSTIILKIPSLSVESENTTVFLLDTKKICEKVVDWLSSCISNASANSEVQDEIVILSLTDFVLMLLANISSPK